MEFSLIFLFSQIILGFLILHKINGNFFLQDIRVFFLCVYTLYSIFFPLAWYFNLINNFNEQIVAAATNQYAFALLSFNIVNIYLRIKFINHGKIEVINHNCTLLFGLLILFCTWSWVFMKNAGVNTFGYGGDMSSRDSVQGAVTQSWVIMSFLIISLFDYLIYNYRLIPKFQKKALIIILLLYVTLQLSIGNRREFAGIILFVLGFYLTIRVQKFKFKLFLILLGLFISSFYIALVRDENTRELAGNEAISLMLASNEFVYPMQTTCYIIRDQDKWDMRFGSTYVFLPLEILVPRSINPDKPSTLGSEFVKKTFRGKMMGFAFTPVSEAYINFGIIGPSLLYVFYGLLFNYLICKQHKYFKFYYFILYGLIFDFCRGEFASIFYAFFILYVIGFNLYNTIAKYKVRFTITR